MINWKNEFTKEIPKLTRGVDLMIPEKKLGYAHCLSSSEVYSIIKHLPYDKKFTVFPNNLFIRRWNSSYNKNVDIINPNRYPHFEIDEETTLFARLSKMLQRISYEVSDEAERVLLSDIATKNVSSISIFVSTLTRLLNQVVNTDAYFLIIEDLIPFKIEDLEMSLYKAEDSLYFRPVYDNFLTEIGHDNFEKASEYFYEFCAFFKINDTLIKNAWNKYTDNEIFVTKRNYETADFSKVLENDRIDIDEFHKKLVGLVDKEDIEGLMKDFCNSESPIDFTLNEYESMALISQGVSLAIVPGKNHQLYNVTMMNKKVYILFKKEGAKSFVFGYNPINSDKLLMIKLDYNPDDFKFVEK